MAKGLLILWVLLVSAAGAQAAAPTTSVYLEELTWPELRADIQAGKTTILVPIGGTEQNGPHMAIGKHNVRVKVLAGKIAHALGDALVAPVVAYVIEGDVDRPSGHLQFPGTITAPPDAFEKILEYAGKSLKLAGFRNIVFLGDSGDNQKADAAAAQRLNREWKATPVRAYALGEYYHASEVEFAQLLKSKGYSAAEIGSHAGLLDTSLMMATDPSLVRADLLGETRPGDGTHGDPRRASAALGQLGVDLIVTRSVAAIRTATSHR
jgi:creatinine amidohydrolase